MLGVLHLLGAGVPILIVGFVPVVGVFFVVVVVKVDELISGG